MCIKLMIESEHGRKKQGRPKVRYSQYISRLITHDPNGLQPREIENLA